MVRLVAIPSVMSTCVLMHRTHMLVGFGGIGREHMQHKTVGIFFSGSAVGGAAKPSVGATSILACLVLMCLETIYLCCL